MNSKHPDEVVQAVENLPLIEFAMFAYAGAMGASLLILQLLQEWNEDPTSDN